LMAVNAMQATRTAGRILLSGNGITEHHDGGTDDAFGRCWRGSKTRINGALKAGDDRNHAPHRGVDMPRR